MAEVTSIDPYLDPSYYTVMPGLLDEVKAYLRITWQDDATDAKITRFIIGGIARLGQLGGIFTDHLDEPEHQLLLDYCRYANSQALEVFEQNFQSQLLDLALRSQVRWMNQSLAVIVLPMSQGMSVCLAVSPEPDEGHQYVTIFGHEAPDFAEQCVPPRYSLWDGISPIVISQSPSDITVVEVDECFKAVRMGWTTYYADQNSN